MFIGGDSMQLPKINILNETNSLLHKKSTDVVFPLSKEDQNNIQNMLTYLEISQIEPLREKYNLRAGMGLAYIQIGIPKRLFVIVNEYEDNKFEKFVVINPQIKSVSEELIYVGEGEGCLSVDREVEGIIPRHARLTIEAYDEQGKLYELRVREELAVAFQHEIDHLNGILFPDLIDKKNPYRDMDKMREI